jgi:LL-diaminopimelate aminotransferase
MAYQISRRIRELSGYAFDELDRRVARLRERGIAVIDFGVGDPRDPTPELVRRACAEGLERHAASGYPSYVGALRFREAAAEWTARRFGVTLDPEREICATIGSKEAIFHFPLAVLDPGDVVLAPNPGYPPYARGAAFAGGRVVWLDLDPEHGFLPRLEQLDPALLDRARILWVNSPHNPTGAVADRDFWVRCLEFCRRHGIILAADESYSEIYFDEPPMSPLELSREGVVVFQSLSKRSCMTGYRVGWVAGDERIIAAFKKLKTNIDSGCPSFIQDAAVAALADESHVAEQRRRYRRRRDILLETFRELGWPTLTPAGTFYIWQPVPPGMSVLELAVRLLDERLALAAMPGSWLAESSDRGNPGEGYLRFALIPSEADCLVAAERLRACDPLSLPPPRP